MKTELSHFLKGKKRVFLTGGAGFIGSHIIELMADTSTHFVVYDNLSSGYLNFIDKYTSYNNITFIEGDIRDSQAVRNSIKECDLVWHLASNTDIIGSHLRPERDMSNGIVGSYNIIEAMRSEGIRDIIFASSGSVYGNACEDIVVSENVGPLMPVSTYGGAKLASEALISSFCYVYGLRGWIYRFGNVLGSRMTHGVIFDFIKRLKEDSSKLLILGDGKQEKNYFLVEECIHGMLFGFNSITLDEKSPCTILNLGTSSVTKVIDIANFIIEEMDLTGIPIEIEGSKKAWPGDQPRVHFSVNEMQSYGWHTKLSSDQSVKVAIRRMLKKANSETWVR